MTNPPDTDEPRRLTTAGTRHSMIVGALVVVALLVSFLAWKAVTWRPSTPSQPASVANLDGAIGVTVYPIGGRPSSPDIEGATLEGPRLDITKWRGHVVVINVWGSWCSPCRAEAPALARAAEETRSQGVRFIGINTRDSAGAARAFARNYGISYPSLSDADGAILMQYSDLVPISAIPSTLVLDRQGQVAARVVGKVDYTTLTGLLDDAITEPTAQPGAAP